jgi:hypothetical protein
MSPGDIYIMETIAKNKLEIREAKHKQDNDPSNDSVSQMLQANKREEKEKEKAAEQAKNAEFCMRARQRYAEKCAEADLTLTHCPSTTASSEQGQPYPCSDYSEVTLQ